MSVDLTNATSVELLHELVRRGGAIAALGEAGLLCARKAEDYNGGIDERDQYFPFGMLSYAQMLHTKSLRLVSLCQREQGAVFESTRDTCLDMINYASFAADWLARQRHD
jgi:hypothetical protein